MEDYEDQNLHGDAYSNANMLSNEPDDEDHDHHAGRDAAPQVEVQNGQDDEEEGETKRSPVAAPRPKNSAKSSDSSLSSSLFEIFVSDPEKKGDGINAYIAYTVLAKTTSADYQNPSMMATRRFTNFAWLFTQLTTKYPGVIVPPIPEKQALGRFEADFVEQRRMALEKFLNRIGAHPILSKSTEFQLFLESSDLDGDIKRKEPKKKMLSSLTDAVQSATLSSSKSLETDEWFENKRVQLETLEGQLKALLKIVDLFVKQRKEVASGNGDLANATNSLGSSELNKSLAASLHHFSELGKKIQEILLAQSASDGGNLEFIVDEQLRLIGSVKIAMEARHKAYAAWKSTDASFIKKKEQLAKLTQQPGKSGKSSTLGTEVEEGEKTVEKAKETFDEITATLKQELGRLDREKLEDFQMSLVKFVQSVIENQKKLVACWEEFLPEIQSL